MYIIHVHVFVLFFWGALESDMRGYCEKCWALVLLPRKRWLHEHHRVCSLLHPFFNHRPIRKVKVRRPVKDP